VKNVPRKYQNMSVKEHHNLRNQQQDIQEY